MDEAVKIVIDGLISSAYATNKPLTIVFDYIYVVYGGNAFNDERTQAIEYVLEKLR